MNDLSTQKEPGSQVSMPQAQATTVLASDVLVPRLLLAQAMSNVVKQRKVQSGDLFRSTDLKVLCSPGSSIDFIPLCEPRADWVIECKVGNRFEYRGIEPRNASNDNENWYWLGNELGEKGKGNTEWRRVKMLSLYALLPSDIEEEEKELEKAASGEMPDLSKSLTPILFRFRSTSYDAGKDVCTFFAQAANFKQNAWKYQLKVSSAEEKSEHGDYFIFKVDRSKPTPIKKEHSSKVEYWARLVKGTALKVDESKENTDDIPF